MSPAEWIGSAAGVVGLLTGSTALGRLLTTHGADRNRLEMLEAWKHDHSVDRSEFENLERDVQNAAEKTRVENLERRVDDAVTKADFTNLARRVDVVEGDVSEVTKLLGDIRVELGQIPGQFSAQKEMLTLQFKAVDHSINGLKQVIQGLTDGRLARRE